MYLEAAHTAADDRRQELSKHAIASESEYRLRAMVSLAESEPGIPILPDALDSDPWALNCQNGTLDLRTGVLRPHSRDDFHTKIIPVEFDPEATCPLWDGFIDRIMDGNNDLIEFLRRALGHSLSGAVSEDVLFFLYGVGANGKTTLLRTALELLGDYGKQADPDLLLVKRGEKHPTSVADLFGARLAVCMEVEQGRQLAEGLVKQLTGGDRRKALKLLRGDAQKAGQAALDPAAQESPRACATPAPYSGSALAKCATIFSWSSSGTLPKLPAMLATSRCCSSAGISR